MGKTWQYRLPMKQVAKTETEYSWGDIRVGTRLDEDVLYVDEVFASSPPDGLDQAIQAANRFLDCLAFQYNEILELDYKRRGWKAECLEDGGTVGGVSVSASVHLVEQGELHDRVMIEKRDADGRVIQMHDSARPGPLPAPHTDSMTFYRRGCAAKESLEGARNFCLAIEQSASAFTSPDGCEKQRWEDAVRVVFDGKDAQLAALAQRVPGPKVVDPAGELTSYLYGRVRCELCHAKHERSGKKPYDEAALREVKNAIPALRAVATALIRYEIEKKL